MVAELDGVDEEPPAARCGELQIEKNVRRVVRHWAGALDADAVASDFDDGREEPPLRLPDCAVAPLDAWHGDDFGRFVVRFAPERRDEGDVASREPPGIGHREAHPHGFRAATERLAQICDPSATFLHYADRLAHCGALREDGNGRGHRRSRSAAAGHEDGGEEYGESFHEADWKLKMRLAPASVSSEKSVAISADQISPGEALPGGVVSLRRLATTKHGGIWARMVSWSSRTRH